MARSIFDNASLQRLDERITQLQPTAAARFGTMTPSTMVCHLIDSIDVATGKAPARIRKSFMASRLMRLLIIYVVPWPKGKAKTVPEMLKTQPANWQDDVAKLRAALSDAARRGPSGSWAPHPAFGNMSARDYGCLIYRHCDHHLKQFGV